MNLFNRLPGFVRTPPGIERDILRRIPRLLVAGSLLFAVPSLAVRAVGFMADSPVAVTEIMRVDIFAIALLIFWWTLLPTLALAAFIVMVMKGPAYVADPYPLAELDPPMPPGRGGW
jgi:hypothetical protein